jgi:signal transduction histidine kinase
METATAATRLLGGRFRLNTLVKSAQGIETWFGDDCASGRPVTVKVAVQTTVSAAQKQRLERAAHLLEELTNPFLIPPLALGHEDDLVFVASPYLPGITLAERLASRPLSVRDSVRLGSWLMMALAQAHGQGVLHGDLKPSNVIVNDGPELRRATLIDFGLSRSDRIQSSIRDLPLQTVRYLCPEQAGLIDAEVSERSDLYAAGAILFECLAGRPLVAGDSITDLLRQLVIARPPALRGLGVPVPRVLDEVVQRLLHKDPRDRYYSAEGALADLSAIEDGLSRGQPEPPVAVGARDQRPTLTEPAFVGRSGDLGALVAVVEQARRGQGRLALIQGESGGGKTRLLAELEVKTGRNAWVLRGQGVAAQAGRPFQMLAGLAEQLIAAARETPGLAATLRERLGEQADAVAAALPELAAILEPRDADKLGPEDFGETRSVNALAGLLDALGSSVRPAVVILDDCQWADEATLKLLRHWQDRRRPARGKDHTVLVVSYRSEEVGEDHPLAQIEGAVRLILPPLDATDIRRLAGSMAGSLPDEAVNVVVELGEGSPFMAGAVLRGMVESGALIREHTAWRIEPSALDDVRSSRAAAVFLARRLERLPLPVLDLLSVGAVLGKEFDLELAASLAGHLPGSDALGVARSALAEARRRHLVWVRPQQGRCVFVHDKLREALLGRLAEQQRRELHRQAARALEQRETRTRGGASNGARNTASQQLTFDIAYHYDAAGEPERALPYALLAGTQARAQHALGIAEQQYRIAARGAGNAEPSVRLRVAEGLGDVLTLRGRYEDATAALSRARSLAASDFDRARLHGKLGDVAFKRGDMPSASEAIERALHLLRRPVPKSRLGQLGALAYEVMVQALHTLLPGLFLARRPLAGAEEELLVVRLLGRLAHVYWFGRGKVACAWAHLREMNLAERYPPSAELAQAYSEHAPVMTLVPWFSRGIAYAEKSLAIRRLLGDIWGQGQSLHFYGVVLYGASRFEACIEKCREATRMLERTGDRWEIHTASWHMAYAQYRLGRLRTARELAERLYREGLQIGDAQCTGMSVGCWAKATGGQVPEEVIEGELGRRTGDLPTTAEVMQAKALCLLRAGRAEDAAKVLERADGFTLARGFRQEYVAPIRPWLATALRAALEALPPLVPRQRRALLRRLRRAVGGGLRLARAYRNNLPHALREAALLAAMMDRERRARRMFADSLREAEAQGQSYELAQTLLARARVGALQGWPDADADQSAARDLLGHVERRVAEPRSTLSPPPVTLSLADRFDQIMDRGRQLASALSKDAVKDAVCTSAGALLRGERAAVIEIRCVDGGLEVGTLPAGWPALPPGLIERAVSEDRPLIVGEGTSDSAHDSSPGMSPRSLLLSPICVRGQPVACLIVVHSRIGRLFGHHEAQLAQYISTLAGAAWENAEGFSRVEQAVRARDEFLAIASHELKTPLTPLQLQLDSLRRSLGRAGLDEHNVTIGIDMMDRQVDRLTNLVQSLLDVARIAGGRMELQPEDLDLGEMAREVAQRFAREAEQAGSALEVLADEGDSLRGRWDPMRLEQVITNLLSNAIKYGAGKPIQVRASATGDRVKLEVQDHGIGLDREDAARIFQRFERAVSSRFYGGLGLGLYITRQIIEAHGGDIVVHSAPGEGATFVVTLPRVAGPGMVAMRRGSDISGPVSAAQA